MPLLVFAMLCVIWGTSFILMKVAGDVFGPISIGAWRALGGAAALAPMWWFMRRRRLLTHRTPVAKPLTRVDWIRLSMPVFIGMAIPWVLQPYLITKHQNSGFVGMLVGLVPLLTIAISVPLLRIWPSARQMIGTTIGLLCFGLLIGVGQRIGMPWHDVLLAAAIPATYALSNTYIKSGLSHIQPLRLTVITLTITGSLLLPLGLALEPINWSGRGQEVVPLLGSGAWPGIAALLLLGVVGTGWANVMFVWLVHCRGPLFAGMVTYLVPLGALLWGGVDREPITLGQVLALLGILAGVAMVQWPSRGASSKVAATAPVPIPMTDDTEPPPQVGR